jgi:hypothetical protein
MNLASGKLARPGFVFSPQFGCGSGLGKGCELERFKLYIHISDQAKLDELNNST